MTTTYETKTTDREMQDVYKVNKPKLDNVMPGIEDLIEKSKTYEEYVQNPGE